MKTIYDPIAKILHWLIFVLVAIEFIIAWTMPGGARVSTPSALMSLHFSFGILIFATIVVRTCWRATHQPPPPPPTLSRRLQLLSWATHHALYALLLVMPILGWAWASSRGWMISFFGLFIVPPLVATGSTVGKALGELHSLLGGVLIALIGLHILSALYHRYILKDEVLARMLPSAPRPRNPEVL